MKQILRSRLCPNNFPVFVFWKFKSWTLDRFNFGIYRVFPKLCLSRIKPNITSFVFFCCIRFLFLFFLIIIYIFFLKCGSFRGWLGIQIKTSTFHLENILSVLRRERERRKKLSLPRQYKPKNPIIPSLNELSQLVVLSNFTIRFRY